MNLQTTLTQRGFLVLLDTHHQLAEQRLATQQYR